MRAENMKFVVEETPAPTKPTVKQLVYELIQQSDDGMTGTELETALADYSGRGIRTEIKSLLDLGHINNDRKCRCHRTSIYKIV